MPEPITYEPLVQLRLAVSPDREQRWQAAASNLNCSLSDWMAMVLDGAAETVLEMPADLDHDAAGEPAAPTVLLVRTA